MLSDYSKISCPLEALKTGRIVRWKGEKKALHYVKRLVQVLTRFSNP